MKQIFLVEDDKAIAKNLTLLLQAEGYGVSHASGQAEAAAMLERARYDLALVDVSLPDGNGFAVCTWIRQTQNIPVIFLTASGDEASVVTGLNMGADDYITKPFRPRELIARIQTAFRKAGAVPSVYEFGGLCVDTGTGVVKKCGKEIFLSALEYRLLLVFTGNPGKVITRAHLLNELWDAAGEYVNDNTLTVYIKRLREKIEDDPSSPGIIRTVRGIGYRLGGNEQVWSSLVRPEEYGPRYWLPVTEQPFLYLRKKDMRGSRTCPDRSIRCSTVRTGCVCQEKRRESCRSCKVRSAR